MLEKAFGAEIEDALGDGIGLLQTKSKLAIELVSEGMLEAKTVTLPGRFPVVCEGFVITDLGRVTYCQSDLCADVE